MISGVSTSPAWRSKAFVPSAGREKHPPKYDPTLVEQLERDQRKLKEKVLTQRLAAADDAAQALRPHQGSARGAVARAMARVAQEIRTVARAAGREWNRQEVDAQQGGMDVSKSISRLVGKARAAMQRATGGVVVSQEPVKDDEDRRRLLGLPGVRRVDIEV